MMKKIFRTPAGVLLLLWLFAGFAPGQNLVCKAPALAAWKTIPKLKYQCNASLTESDDEVLTQANRRRAINLYTKALEKFADSRWWSTRVDDLNVCDFRKKPGALTKDQKREFEGGEYYFRLRGNNQYRVIVTPDPCYQTGFNGANVFLLNRVGRRVFAAEVIDGFYTRADFPLGFDYAIHGTETIIEIATTSGGLYPTETNYYFTIDPRTKRAVPKNLFKDNDKMTHRIYSDMILGEPEEYGLPRGSESLRIITNHKLEKRFYVFENTLEKFDETNQKYIRVIFKWNGKYYE
jgi:hypothetical protein